MSQRAKRRNKRLGIDARRRGQAATRGGFPSEAFPTIRVLIVPHVQGPKRPQFHVAGSIADLYGSNAHGDMTDMKIDWLRWEKRKAIQREKAKARQAA